MASIRKECVARTSKSPRAVLLAALATAKRALPLYSHRNSPRKFTQHQLFACLVLKNFLKTDYRGVVAHLADCPSLTETLGLARVPHYTTLQKAARRLLASVPAKRLLDATVREHLGRKRRVPRAAIDSTGLECSSASSYFVRRRAAVGTAWKTMVYHHYPKLAVVCDIETHFILAYQAGRGPKVDISEFQPLLIEALTRVRLTRIAADAGYDSEANHRFARQQCHVRSLIPPTRGRPTDKPARGHYRRLMQTRFDLAAYRDRVQVEAVFSMLKRRLEAFVRGRTAWSQRRELRLKVLTHNVMILVRIKVFYRALQNYYDSSLGEVPPPPHDWQYFPSENPINIGGFNWWVDRKGQVIQVPMWFTCLTIVLIAAVPWVRWKFSLRTLLIATTLVAVVLGMIVWMSRAG